MKPLLANPNEGSCKKMGKEESMSSTGGDNNKIESTSLIVQDMRLASINTLLKTARDVFADKVAQSNELDLSAEERVPKFEAKDLMIGRVVGRGGFCVVQDVKGLGTNGIAWGDDSSVGGFIRRIRGKRPEEEFPSRQQRLHPTNDGREVNQAGVASTMDEWTSASELSDQVDEKKKRPLNLMKRKEKRKYVLKRMGVDLEKITFLKGVVDLAMETRFLASLDHINIIGLYGVSGDGPFVQGYFLILEKMKEILPKRIKRWMDIDRQCKGITGVFTGSKKKVRTLESDRIATAVDIARGAHYLHERNIVFRDLKPDNIGFDYAGVLKIFDFGLAKELQESERTEGGLYKMTGLTGALRYMAPEVGLSQPYNLSADVYSWAIVFWYILALEPPFCLYSPSMINDRVFLRDYRPKLFTRWSPRIANIINQSWSKNVNERPTFEDIMVVLKSQLAEMDPKHAYIMMDSHGNLKGIAE